MTPASRIRRLAEWLAAALALWLALAWGGAGAQAEPPAMAVLVSLRPHWNAPAGVALMDRPLDGRSWTTGLDLSPDGQGVVGLWLRRTWRVEPDTLAQVGLQAGYNLRPGDAGRLPAGAWAGLYVGQRLSWRSALLELGAELRVPVGSPGGIDLLMAAWTGVSW